MHTNSQHLLEQVIQPTLDFLDEHHPLAAQLLLTSALLASNGDPLCHDSGFGLYQISAERHRGLWEEYLAFRPNLASEVRGLASQKTFLQAPERELVTNLAYATAVTWMCYRQNGTTLPDTASIDTLAGLWQQTFASAQAAPIALERLRSLAA